MKKQIIKNIFFKTTSELNTKLEEILSKNGVIENIIPIHYHNYKNVDITNCEEILIIYHLEDYK